MSGSDRLAQLVLVWLLARRDRTGVERDAHRALEGLGVEMLRGAAGRQRVDEAFARLAGSGGIVAVKRGWKAAPAGERAALGFLGLKERPRGLSWRQVKERYLVASRLGVPAAALRGADGVRAAILARELGAGEPGRSSLAAVRDALAWRELGVEPGAPFTLRAVLGLLLGRQLGGGKSWDVDEAVAVLAARAVGARRSGVDELRGAIVRRWFESAAEPTPAPAPGPEPTPPELTPVSDDLTLTSDQLTPVSDLTGFADDVVAAAEATGSGRFGDDKVFIAHVWRTWRARGGTLELDAFKTRLVEANRTRALTLSRADLVEAMDPTDVRESETRHLAASFHFVRVPAQRRP